MNLEELQKIVYEAGIVGAGGAGFPTHRKFSESVKQIVVNAAECEPLMMVDHHILEFHLQELVDTLNLLLDVMGAREAIIGIKGKNMHLLDEKIVASLKRTRVSIHEIPDIYPAGDEVVLTYETTGKIIPVAGTPMDFQTGKRIGDDLHSDYPPIKFGKGFDSCWAIDGAEPGQLQTAAELYAPESGRCVEVTTNQPGAVVYTGNWLAGSPKGKCGRSYFDYEGVAIECQHCPDSPNKPEYPTTVLRPEEQFEEAIIWQFSVA